MWKCWMCESKWKLRNGLFLGAYLLEVLLDVEIALRLDKQKSRQHAIRARLWHYCCLQWNLFYFESTLKLSVKAHDQITSGTFNGRTDGLWLKLTNLRIQNVDVNWRKSLIKITKNFLSCRMNFEDSKFCNEKEDREREETRTRSRAGNSNWKRHVL